MKDNPRENVSQMPQAESKFCSLTKIKIQPKRVLILGNMGSGKSSLVRTLCGEQNQFTVSAKLQ